MAVRADSAHMGKVDSSDSSRPVVLVVDDDPDLRMLANVQLGEGFDVIQAENGEECIRKARSESPDVILLDMMMPGMNGAEVLTALSDDPATRNIPVIFLSGLGTTEDRVAGLERGAVDYITKPPHPKELVARVGAAARTRARREETASRTSAAWVVGLPQRKSFEQRLSQEISRSERSGAALSILLIDLDQLEEVNEQMGREAGDQVLAEVADALGTTLRTSDTLYRYGGDEFAAILPDTELATAYLAAERCRAAMKEIKAGGRATSASVGVAQFSSGRTAEEVIARAEIALFRAKESGGSRTWRADDPRRHGLNPVALSEELTEREWDVVFHLSHRRTEQEIARRLGISRGTVRSHKARIRRKLHVSPDIRLSDFVRTNFRDLVDRLPDDSGAK
ncbi:MAG: diguanylate cyclase [Actinomycetota bacterium]|nr:diguanylate cyclase [Actinomycetota bacterium]